MMGICAAQSVFGQAPQAPQAQQAQPVGPREGPTSIALVDVGHILNNHPTIKLNMEAIKAEMTKAQEDIENRRKALLTETEMVQKNYDTNSPAFKEKQEQLISQESKLRVDFMGKEKEFAEKQAGVIYQSYQSINQAITVVANHYKYDVVLRYSREQNEMDPKKPTSVNFGIQRDVLFMNPQVDVTDIVLNFLQKSMGAAAGSAATAPAANTAAPTRSANGAPNGTPGRPIR